MVNSAPDTRPLVAHLVERLDVGGLENGVVNIINHMDPDRYRHAVICLKSASPEFAARITRLDVEIIELNKPEGKSPLIYFQVWKTLRALKPAILHSNNISTIDCAVPAWLAGTRGIVHTEHGWDSVDAGRTHGKYNRFRRLLAPFIGKFIAVSGDIRTWLVDTVGIPPAKAIHIFNGVDGQKFHPIDPEIPRIVPENCPFDRTRSDLVVFGTVGRMAPIKDQIGLVRAFAALIRDQPALRARVRLAIVGDGPLRDTIQQEISTLEIADLVWIPGNRQDMDDIFRSFDVFVLPSLSEGISYTMLEAMASGLPIIATKVGGNPELIEDHVQGLLPPSADTDVLKQAMARLATTPVDRERFGKAARAKFLENYSIDAMLNQYIAIYDALLGQSAKIQ